MILAGGTGGHVFPALAAAQEFMGRGDSVFWMGTRQGLEAQVVAQAGIDIQWLSVLGFRGKNVLAKFKAVITLFRAFMQAFLILRRVQPDVVLGMGGFVAAPGGVIAWLLQIPLVIHEQNSIPGTVNRFLARFSTRVLEAFPGSFDSHIGASFVGNPLRKEIVSASKKDRIFGDETLRVLVLGGSQGAAALNRIVPQGLALCSPLKVLHQSGSQLEEQTRIAYKDANIDAEVKAFISDMSEAYRWADFAICRSGAMTVSELAAVGLPSILIPFPYAIDDHQTANARILCELGAARMIDERSLTSQMLAETVRAIVSPKDGLRIMSKNAQGFAKLDAAERVAETCALVAGGQM